MKNSLLQTRTTKLKKLGKEKLTQMILYWYIYQKILRSVVNFLKSD